MSLRRRLRVPRWSALHLRAKGLIVVALPVLPMALFWTLIGLALVRDSPPANTAGRGREIATGLVRVLGALLEAEASARATLAGSGEAAAARHRAAADRMPDLLRQVDRLIIDAGARREFEALRGAAAEALEHLLTGARPARPGAGPGGDPLQLAVAAIGEVRTRIAAIDARQRVLTAETARRNYSRQLMLLAALLGASIVCTAGGVVAALVLARGLERRVAELSDHADRLARGEPIDDVPDGTDEIAQLGARLREASRLLRQRDSNLLEVNRELEAFSYSVSHDLRAPLRAIDGFSQVIEEDQAARLDDEGRDALRRVRAAASRMGVLIDELLSLSRITRQELRGEAVDLTAMANSLLVELARQWPDRRVTATVADGLMTYGDPRMLRIALQNLLHNAWKYTGKVDDARVEVGTTGEGDARAFHVRDNGAGFDMHHAGKLFGAFQRLHSERDFEGTGIGLATVQRIVHRHGGRIWAESQVGRGATFFFTIGPEGS
jgi:signal transduction histidine kinase